MQIALESAPEWFPLFLAMFYLFAKLLLKGFIRIIVGVPYDVLENSAWFPVDLLVLVLGTSISADLTGKGVAPHHERVAWYAVLVLVLCVVWGCYGWFLRLRKEERGKAAFGVTVLNLMLGLGPLIFTLSQFGDKDV